MTIEFIHLHVHSDRSILDSILKIPDLVKRVKELGMDAVAITDHGVATGAISFYEECVNAAVKPIIGMEAYLSPTDDHSLREKIEGVTPFYHLTLLAMNRDGVSEIYRLSSLGFTEGFYYKPRISLKLLEEIGKNLIILGACMKGPISWNLLNDNRYEAISFAARLRDSFPNRFYFELMDHGIKEQKELNEELLDLSRVMKIPWIPTNDVHFLMREDHYYHSLMMCLQLGLTLQQLKESSMIYSPECYLKSKEEMISFWGKDNCRRTKEISEMIDIKLELGKPIFPHYLRN